MGSVLIAAPIGPLPRRRRVAKRGHHLLNVHGTGCNGAVWAPRMAALGRPPRLCRGILRLVFSDERPRSLPRNSLTSSSQRCNAKPDGSWASDDAAFGG